MFVWKPICKDRGKDVLSAPWYPVFNGDRINDHHLALKEKREARERMGGGDRWRVKGFEQEARHTIAKEISS